MKGDVPKPVRCPKCRKRYLNGATPSTGRAPTSPRQRRRTALRRHIEQAHPGLTPREVTELLDRSAG